MIEHTVVLQSMKKLVLSSLLLIWVTNVLAQPVERLVTVIVTPNHADWLYKPGEPVNVTIAVYRNNVLLKGAKLRYEIGPEKMPPTKTAMVTLKEGTLALDAGTLKQRGFCAVLPPLKSMERNTGAWLRRASIRKASNQPLPTQTILPSSGTTPKLIWRRCRSMPA